MHNRIRNVYFTGLTLILFSTLFALYGQAAVYRYPALSTDPAPRPLELNRDHAWSITASGAYLKAVNTAHFRAFQPNISLHVDSQEARISGRIRVENIHPDAYLETKGIASYRLEETSTGLLREVIIKKLKPDESFTLSWHFPERNRYRFVAIGDTGGDRELVWGLKRAQALNADFVLHMGDVYYDASEIQNLDEYLNNSLVPVYTAVGNHDFQGPQGNSIEVFLQDIGPLNARFKLLDHCFINLDTGAFMYPPDDGERAGILAAEVVSHRRHPSRCSSYIVFTHKPIVGQLEVDFPQRDHALYGRDAQWLISQLQQLDNVTMIAGHIHNDFEFEQDGMKTFVTGSGLAHKDVIEGKFRARVLVGEIEAGSPLKTQWALNAMPREYHCSKRFYQGLKKAGSPLTEALEAGCVREPE